MQSDFPSLRRSIFQPLQIAFLTIALALPLCAHGQAIDPTAPPSTKQNTHPKSSKSTAHKAASKEAPALNHAIGTFDEVVTPLSLYDKSAPPTLGRRAFEKHIHGDLEGVSKGEMLITKTSVEGSQAYVAIEYFAGTFKGHYGTFVLQHKGILNQGKLDLVLNVVPDSGSGAFAGVTGTFNIAIVNGKHTYDFAYTLPEPPKEPAK